MVSEFRGRAIAAFNALPDGEQEKEIGRATSFASKALNAELSFVSTADALATKRRTDAVCASDSNGAVWTVETGNSAVDDNEAVLGVENTLSRGVALAFNALRRWGGVEESLAFYRGLTARGACRARDREAEMFKEAYRCSLTFDARLWAASKGPDRSLTAAQAIAQGGGKHLGLLGIHLGTEATKKAATVAALESAAETLAASLVASAAECERKARMKWRWQKMFDSIQRYTGRLAVRWELEHAIDMRQVAADDYEFAKERFDYWYIYRRITPRTGDWAELDKFQQDLAYWRTETHTLELEHHGMFWFARTWCRRAAKRVACAKPKPVRRQRFTVAEREAFHASAVRALPAYLKPVDASAYTKPVEEIASVRLGNLPLAEGPKQCGLLRKTIRDFVEEHHGALAESKAGDGAIFTPLRRGTTIGYAFVKFRDGASATAFLARMATLEPKLVDPATGTPSALLIERAASEHKSKAQMEAAKAKGAAPAVTAVSLAKERIIALMKADAGVKVAAPLVPVCLGASAKAAKQAAVDEAEAVMKAKIDAMFPAALPCASVATAKEFEVSFACVAAKPAVKAAEVVFDPFHTVINGETWGIFHDRGTELGAAQAALSSALEAETEKRRLLTQKRRRAQRAKRNAALGPDDKWGPEPDTDDEC